MLGVLLLAVGIEITCNIHRRVEMCPTAIARTAVDTVAVRTMMTLGIVASTSITTRVLTGIAQYVVPNVTKGASKGKIP